MDRNYTIYGYLNIITMMWYVGRTSQSQSRRAGKDGQCYKTCPKFYSAIQEFGWSTFEYHILATTTDLEESYRLEQYWIEQKNSIENGYNVSIGGKSGTGVKESEDRRKKISDSHKGMKYSDEVKKHMSESHMGIKYSEERNKKISEYHQGRWVNYPSISKKVQQFTKDGQFVAEYPSMMEIQRQKGFSVSNISACCRGKCNQAYGFVWKFL